MGEIENKANTAISPVGGEPDFTDALSKAANIIKAGGIVAYPTETFYGLGVDATNQEAVSRLFSVKGRGEGKPILILVSSEKMLRQYVRGVPSSAKKLINHFWPGPLTLIMYAKSFLPDILTARTGKIGVRISPNLVATALVEKAGTPITSTSANKSSQPPCTSAQDVSVALGDNVDLILDGGKTPGGLGSTILDVTISPPRLIRQGKISVEQLEFIIGEKIST